MARLGRKELVTVGQNPNLQLVGSDPAGGPYDLGLMIGPNAGQTAPQNRQLFLLARRQFGAHQRGRLVGFRQYLTIGTYLPTGGAAQGYLVERPVVTPTWKFSDGNVMWSIRRVPPNNHYLPNAGNADGVAFRTAASPALLYETVTGVPPYVTTTAPNGGRPPGTVLTPELGRFFDMRAPAWSEPSLCDVEFEGPCDVAFYASIQQTNPGAAGGAQLLPPATPVLSTVSGAVPEDAFLQTYASDSTLVRYVRVAGALIFEDEVWAPGGMPKTYRSTSTGDRLTRDTAETNSNEIRQSGAVTSGTANIPPDCEGGVRK